ncbi:MAG: carboxypeptidase-like regulatory domain-containing protein [Bacteroidetes bacterium]|nr:carboxypeptidase-like regulatory domain-containing protein [Bacteroidota bacterium]
MKRFLSLLGFFLFFISFVNAQSGKMSGKITESGTGKAVSNATVKISTLNMNTVTDQEGFFEIKNIPYGKYTVSVSSGTFENYETSIDLNAESVTLPNVELKKKAGEGEGLSEISTIVLDQEDENKDQNISGLLHSSDDIFTSTAGYIFGSMSFRPRGYDADNRQVLINGTNVSDPENGRVTFNDWGGLNDAMRNKQIYNYNEPTPYTFGDIGGLTNIDTRASGYRKQIKLSYSLTNRTYRDRIMLTYATGLMKNGWAFTLSGSRRWSQEGYVEGTFYDAWGYFLSAEKRMGRHSLGLTIFGAPTKRGTQSATVQEAYDLSGTNYYNPNWGYQNGKARNARVRANNEPEFILNHVWNINDKTKLTTSANYSFGTNSWSSLNWYNAPDPRPDYYRYLPSYHPNYVDPLDPATQYMITQQWQNDVNTRQINWDKLIEINKLGNMEGIQANYIVENNVTKTSQFAFNTVVNKEMNPHATVNGGLNFKLYNGHHYKVLDDLLGGNYWVNIDQFNKTDFPGDTASWQLDLNNPNKIIHQGDIFGYDYVSHLNTINLWGQGNFTYNKLDFFVAASLTGTQFWRTGNYRNGRYPENSYGNSKIFSFLNYGVKGGITYKITGRHYLTFTGFYETTPPYFSNTFVSPKTRNTTVNDVKSETAFGGDASYIMRYPWLNLRFTYYYTQFLDGATVVSYYQDQIVKNTGFGTDNGVFVNNIMTGINRVHQGIEFGAEVKVNKMLKFFAVAAVGNYIYTSRPQTTISYDNGSLPDTTFTTYIKNFYIPSTPQTALSGGLKFNYHYWFLDVNANYYDNNWLSFTSERRTEAAISGLGPGDPLIKEITQEQKLKSGFTLDASIGKNIRIKYKYFININLSVSNILDNKDIQNWGYEQNRFDFVNKNTSLFPPKYLYYYGRTFFLNLSFRM